MDTPNIHRILIVDDSPEAAICFTRALERSGFAADYVTSGFEAISSYKESQDEGHPFSLLILDWAMPAFTGIELAHLLRDNGDDIKIAFLTAYHDEVEMEKAKTVDAEVWGKPITIQELTNNVRRVLCMD